MELDISQMRNLQYDRNQTTPGSPLKTLKGSLIKRYGHGVGKLIGTQLYFHKCYADELLPEAALDLIEEAEELIPFDYNCIRYDTRSKQIALVESPDFDEAREPVVGRMFLITPNGETLTTRFFNQIWHHKWLFVGDDYAGFDVAQSWEWSRKWLSILTETADGSSLANWNKQLQRFHLV